MKQAVAIGIVGGMMTDGAARGGEPIRPCGRCRQVLNEAAQMGGRELAVYCAGAEGEAYERHLLSELLPHAFGPGDLGIG